MQVTSDLLLAFAPSVGSQADAWAEALTAATDRWDVSTPQRLAMFLAQCAHESAEFTRLSENLNYSWQALRRVFPGYFQTDREALAYQRNPMAIANRVYANRMGNGDEASGDGWKHRGAGAIQLTGKDNHRNCSLALYGDERLVDDPTPLTTCDGAAQSSAWFWAANGLNRWADAGDFDGACDVINRGHKTAPEGDAVGYQDRAAYWTHLKSLLGVA